VPIHQTASYAFGITLHGADIVVHSLAKYLSTRNASAA
jgi:O-acetylhomoserine/O-acetylserine sulfhydrylase-like pyridoxal-dependent enzyme